MKNFSKIALISMLLAISSNAMADNDYDITANGNITTQLQFGLLNHQDMKLGVIAKGVDADVEITANDNDLFQAQAGLLNHQTMSVATVGCNC